MHAPLQHKNIRTKKVPWITGAIKQLIITRDRLKRKAIITDLEIDWLNYKTRNKVNIQLRNAKKIITPLKFLIKIAILKRLGKL